MKKIIFITIILGYFLPGNVCAKDKIALNNARITVRVIDQHIEESALYLLVLEDNICGDIGAKEQQCMPDADGEYKFTIKNLNKLVSFHLQFDNFRLFSGFISPGDDLKITFNRNGNRVKQNDLRFSGKGSFKMEVLWRLNFLNPVQMVKIPEAKTYTEKSINLLLKKADSAYLSKRTMLESCRDSLDKQVFGLLAAKIFGMTYENIVTYFIDSQRSHISDEILDMFYSRLKMIKPDFSSEIACRSDDYIRYLMYRSKAIAALGNKNLKERFLCTFKEIMTEEDIFLRERLLVYFIFRDSSFKSSDNPELVYANVLQNISDPGLHRLIDDLRMARTKGTPAYNFTLTDIKGHTVSLSDFRKKVVVVECWFTSCSSCAHLSQLLEREVMPKFKGRKDLVFLNVNVDETKVKWLRSLKEGIYSSPGCINLFTQGLGVNHPFIVKYQFRGFPQLLLIDKAGNLVSSNFRGTAQEMSNKISEVLNAK